MTRYGRHLLATPLIAAAIALNGCAQLPHDHAAADNPHANAPPLVQSAQVSADTAFIALEPVSLRSDHPQTYTVVPGDTLWAIAGRFLNDPWQWPRVWRQNPAIQNPTLIYPGDVIELYYQDGQPQLHLASSGRPTVKLSPRVRVEDLVQPIPTLPREAIEPFLERSRVLSKAEWAAAPYILGGIDNRSILIAPDRIYARGIEFDQRRYGVFRPGGEYRDPASRQSLGYDAIYVGEAVLEQDGDPATLALTSNSMEVRPGDRLIAVEDEDLIYQFIPHPVPSDTEGQIIALMNDGGAMVSRYQSVVMDRGEQEGMEPGHVLAIFKAGREVVDPLRKEKVRLPDEQAGVLMIYKVYDRVSYGLVIDATRPVHNLDRVGTP